VLRLVAKGLSLGEVAAKLGLSERTVATYRARVGLKRGLSSNVELTRYALKNGLADSGQIPCASELGQSSLRRPEDPQRLVG